jgi:hypothetical protein
MDYNDILAAKGADTKANLDEAKRKAEEKKAWYQDRSNYEAMKSDIDTGKHANWTDEQKEDWLTLNRIHNSAPTMAQQNQADQLSSQMPLNPTLDEIKEKAGLTPEQIVEKSLASSKDDDPAETTANYNNYKLDNKATDLEAQKQRWSPVEDYFSGSMSDTWRNLSDTDKKILLFDQIGTALKNASKARLPMYSAYGKDYEGKEMGDEKSMLQNMLSDSLKAGLDRRNSRLKSQLAQQLKIANFPVDIAQRFETEKIPNRVAIDLIGKMKDVRYRDALKAYLTKNPTAPIEGAMKAVDRLF